jgi:CRP-like cAMP-binding protein
VSYITKHNISAWPSSSAVKTRKYRKSQVLFHKDDEVTSIGLIKSGWVKVVDYDKNGQEKILLLLHEGDLLPIIWRENVISNLHYWYETVTEVEISRAPKSSIEKLLKTDLDLNHQLFNYTQCMLHELLLRVESIEVTSAKDRLLKTLLYLSKKSNPARYGYIKSPIKLTQSLLAALTGVTRETISTSMAELEKEKIIKYTTSRNLLIKDDISDLVQ